MTLAARVAPGRPIPPGSPPACGRAALQPLGRRHRTGFALLGPAPLRRRRGSGARRGAGRSGASMGGGVAADVADEARAGLGFARGRVDWLGQLILGERGEGAVNAEQPNLRTTDD